MPTELIKCSNAVRIDTRKGSGHYAPSGMVENISADFLLLRLWFDLPEDSINHLLLKEEADIRNLYCKAMGSFSCWVSQNAETEHKVLHMSGFPQS